MSAPRVNMILSLYKKMLRESQKFTGYNYRTYAVRRIRDEFKANKNETNSTKLQELQKTAEKNYEIIQRQVIISQIYKEPTSLVIETNRS